MWETVVKEDRVPDAPPDRGVQAGWQARTPTSHFIENKTEEGYMRSEMTASQLVCLHSGERAYSQVAIVPFSFSNFHIYSSVDVWFCKSHTDIS